MAARKTEKAIPQKREDGAVEGDGSWVAIVVAHVRGDEGNQGHPEKQVVVGPEQAGVGMTSRVQQVVMVDPHDGDDHEAEQVAEELRRQAEKRRESCVARQFQLQDHDGDDDGDDAVAEGLDAVGAHGALILVTTRSVAEPDLWRAATACC